jgi:tetratricopeptide (TPR) repeat protein
MPVRLPLIALLAVLSGGALCGDTAPKNNLELIQEQACVANIQKKDYQAAETRCMLCLEYNERNPQCLNALGVVWYARGVDDKARPYFVMAAREDNNFAQPRSNLGVLEFNLQNYEEAARLFASAIEIDPRFQDGRYNLALSYLRLGENAIAKGKEPTEPWKQAEDQYRRFIELFPQDPRAYHDLGVIMMGRSSLEKKGNKVKQYVEDAEVYFKRCLELDGANETCHGNFAHLLLANGRFDESLFHFVQCLAANSKNALCATELQQAYAGSQLQSEALKKYMAQLIENPGYGAGHYGFCIALFDKGLVDMGVTECENALKLDSSLCLSHYQLAKHYKGVLDKDLALENCRAMISCAGETKYGSEVADCKEIVAALEVQ